MNRSLQALSLLLVLALGSTLRWELERRGKDAGAVAFAASLARVGTLDASLEEDVLHARSGLLTHYDTLVQHTMELRQLAGTFPSLVAASSLQGPQLEQMQHHLERLAQDVAAREQLVEQFKTENAVLLNASRHFPVVCRQVMEAAAAAHRPDVGEVAGALLGDVAAFRLRPDKELEDRIQGLLTRLLELGGSDAEIAVMARHAHVMLSRRRHVDLLTTQLLKGSIHRRIDGLEDAFARHAAQGHAQSVMVLWLAVGNSGVLLLLQLAALLAGRRQPVAALVSGTLPEAFGPASSHAPRTIPLVLCAAVQVDTPPPGTSPDVVMQVHASVRELLERVAGSHGLVRFRSLGAVTVLVAAPGVTAASALAALRQVSTQCASLAWGRGQDVHLQAALHVGPMTAGAPDQEPVGDGLSVLLALLRHCIPGEVQASDEVCRTMPATQPPPEASWLEVPGVGQVKTLAITITTTNPDQQQSAHGHASTRT